MSKLITFTIKKVLFNILLVLSVSVVTVILYLVTIGYGTDLNGSIFNSDSNGTYSICYSIKDINTKKQSTYIHMNLLKPFDDGISMISSKTKIVNGSDFIDVYDAYGINLDEAINFSTSDTIDCTLVFKTTGKIINHKNDSLLLITTPINRSADSDYYSNNSISIGSYYTFIRKLMIYLLIFIICSVCCWLLRKNINKAYNNEKSDFYNIVNTVEKVLISKGTYQYIYQILLNNSIDICTINRVNTDIHNSIEYLLLFFKKHIKQSRISEGDIYLLALLTLKIPNKVIQKLLNISDKTIHNRTSQLRSILKSYKYIQF